MSAGSRGFCIHHADNPWGRVQVENRQEDMPDTSECGDSLHATPLMGRNHRLRRTLARKPVRDSFRVPRYPGAS